MSVKVVLISMVSDVATWPELPLGEMISLLFGGCYKL